MPHRILRAIIPNAITLGALLAGYVSVLQAFEGAYITASFCIILACILDMFDGAAARLLKSSSEFGVQLDSLADVMNYGMAPALLFHRLYFEGWGVLGVAISFLPVACAALRLARFNVSANPDIPTRYYVGLPTTIAALLLAGYILFADAVYVDFGAPWQATLLILTLSFLMVSEVQYEKRNPLSPRYILKTRRLITGALIVVTVVALPQVGFFAWGFLYILYGLLRSGVMTIWHYRRMMRLKAGQHAP